MKMLIKTYQIKDNIAVVKVEGLIDTTTTQEMNDILNNILNTSCVRIIIDLINADYISSTGWNTILSKVKLIREHGGDIKLVRMQQEVFEVFELLELSYMLRSFKKIENAVNDFARESAAKVGNY